METRTVPGRHYVAPVIRIAEGSGLYSGLTGIVVPFTLNNDTRDLAHDYPFVGGRTPQSMKWSCVYLENGKFSAFPNTRLEKQ